MHWRIRFSRLLGRLLFGRDEMLSSLADQRQWRIRHGINALFLDRQHCARASEWEAGLTPEADPLAAEWLRRADALDERLRLSDGA
jgi:hypothetical protein